MDNSTTPKVGRWPSLYYLLHVNIPKFGTMMISWASFRFEKRLRVSINPQTLSIFSRVVSNRSETLMITMLMVMMILILTAPNCEGTLAWRTSASAWGQEKVGRRHNEGERTRVSFLLRGKLLCVLWLDSDLSMNCFENIGKISIIFEDLSSNTVVF